MKHLVKRLTGLMLCIILAIGMLPVAGRKAKAAESGNTVFKIGDGDVNIVVNSTGTTVRGNAFTGNEIVIEGDKDTAVDNSISIEVGENLAVTVVLRNVNIDVSGVFDTPAVRVKGDGTVTFELEGVNTVKSAACHAGVEKNSKGKLIFFSETEKTGSLTAIGGDGGAGIGGGVDGNGSNITITGGTVEAKGGEHGAGIGGGVDGNGSNIIITGGTIIATGGDLGAGIGGGFNESYSDCGAGTNITISGGMVTATGGDFGTGIGGGDNGIGTDITISGGTVIAKGGEEAAGIGGGKKSIGTRINIGNDSDATVKVSVTATGGYGGAGIGGGAGVNGKGGAGTVITITGGMVNATGGYGGAGIGGGNTGDGASITISGNAVIIATVEEGSGAGIGGGSYGSCSSINIEGNANVTATGGDFGAGIGGGCDGNGTCINIGGDAEVIASGGINAAGIGGGQNGNGSKFTITGNAVVKAAGGINSCSGAAIGQGVQGVGVDIYDGAESIITTITKESSGLDGQVWKYPAGTSAEKMAEDVENKMDGAEQVEVATITFDANGGQGATFTDEITPGDKLTANSFTREGFVFSGWNTETGGNGTSYSNEEIVTFIGKITLYAQWAKLYNVTVKNGTATDNNKEISQAIKGATVTVTAATLDEGQAFVEWSCKDTPVTLENNSAPETTFVMPENDVTVVAIIKEILIDELKDSYEYHEGGITPEFKVAFKGTDFALLDGTDYEVTFTNNDKPGTASVTVTISGPRAGSKKVTFKITGNTVRWLDGDGSVLEEAYYSDTMGMPSYSKNITPTGKEQTGHVITFIGWDNGTVSSNEYGKVTEYKPLFSDEKITYKVTFVDEDATELQSSMVDYGTLPVYNGENPTGSADVVCSAEFIGWDKEIVTVTGDATYTATYKKYNEHDYQPVAGTAVAPTCTKAGKEADQKCSRCETVITGKEIAATGHTFDQEVVDEKYLKSAADCITAAVYYKSCKCGEKSTDEKDIFTSGEPAGHKWKAATGYAPKTCEVCGLEEGQKVTYDPIKNQVFVWTKGSKEPFVLTIKRSQDDVNCFLHYLNTLLDGAEIKVEARSGSTIITIPAETLEKLSVGEHKITVVFDDWKADFALSIAEAVATPTPAVDATPVTGDTMPVVPVVLLFFITFFAAAGIVWYRKKACSSEI